jgi:lipopolysaccharide export system permease protein
VDRYLLALYGRYLAIGVGVAIALVCVVDLVRTLDRTVAMRPPIAETVEAFLYRVPGFLFQALPVIVLLSTVFLFLGLERHRELDAFKAAGLSIHRISAPVLAAALLISLCGLVVQESLLPTVNRWAREMDEALRGRAVREQAVTQTDEWYRIGERQFLRVDAEPAAREATASAVAGAVAGSRVVLVEVDEAFRLRARMDARQARPTWGGWELAGAVRHDAASGGRVVLASTMLPVSQRLEVGTRRPAEMSFWEMRGHLAARRAQGRAVGAQVVELYAKLSFAFVHPIMVLVAIPLAIGTTARSSRMFGMGVGIGIAIGYWIVHAMALSSGKADLLPPMLAAWTANLVSLGFGSVRYLRLPT